MIDLHLHTTASDGRSSPERLVEEAAQAGLTTLAVTDHDTTAACVRVGALCRERRIAAIAGIEITAVESGRDVHVLGYFIDPADATLEAFLVRQRQGRIARVEAIAQRLESLGVPVDVRPLLEAARRQDGHSIGRPQVADAMIAAGHVTDRREAFDRWLAQGCPAFVPRSGARVEEVIAIIHEAGGIASLAHPGLTRIDDRIPELRARGLDAVEAYHSDHPPQVQNRYSALATALGLLVTGGSDYHGDPDHALAPGSVTLPPSEWERILAAR